MQSLIRIGLVVSKIWAKMPAWKYKWRHIRQTRLPTDSIFLHNQWDLKPNKPIKVWTKLVQYFLRYSQNARLEIQMTSFPPNSVGNRLHFFTQSMGPKTQQTYTSLNKIGLMVSKILAKISNRKYKWRHIRQTRLPTDSIFLKVQMT